MYRRQLKYLDLVLKNNCAPHAFIFYGADSIYQKNLAKDFLARLNGPQFATQIKEEKHPDALFIERRGGKKEISIDQIRELKKFVSRTPLYLHRKGVFITEAEYLNEEGWNALLKTLEEPVGNTIVFIISSHLKNIPLTITSRAVTLPFYGEAGGTKSLSPKGDIILGKLAGLNKMSWAERIDLAEEITKKDNFFPLLDSWLLQLRAEVLNDSNQNKINFIEQLAETKNLIAGTNVNARLALENLFLKI